MRPLVQEKVRRWLTHHGFDGVIPPALVRFCATYEEKVEFCRERGTTHFIDNNLQALAPMVGRVPHLYLFSHRRARINAADSGLWHLVDEREVTLVSSWQEFGEKALRGW